MDSWLSVNPRIENGEGIILPIGWFFVAKFHLLIIGRCIKMISKLWSLQFSRPYTTFVWVYNESSVFNYSADLLVLTPSPVLKCTESSSKKQRDAEAIWLCGNNLHDRTDLASSGSKQMLSNVCVVHVYSPLIKHVRRVHGNGMQLQHSLNYSTATYHHFCRI